MSQPNPMKKLQSLIDSTPIPESAHTPAPKPYLAGEARLYSAGDKKGPWEVRGWDHVNMNSVTFWPGGATGFEQGDAQCPTTCAVACQKRCKKRLIHPGGNSLVIDQL